MHMGMALICKGVLENRDEWDKKYNKLLLIPGIPQIGFIIIAGGVIFAAGIMIFSEFFDE